MRGYGPETFGQLNAERYDIDEAPDATAAVALLADLAGGGAALELAIGTGRIALPLAARGVSVRGIDASPEMVARLRAKPGGDAVPVTIGDFADVAVDGAFDLIFLVFNTLFNLTSQNDQVRCFQNVTRRLTAPGVFVVEAFVPEVGRYQDGQRLRTVRVGFDSVVVEASVHDPVTQTIDYQYITTTREGVSLTPLPMRYAWPNEIDLMARLAGLELRNRWGGWDRSPFTASSEMHVSVYGRAGPENPDT